MGVKLYKRHENGEVEVQIFPAVQSNYAAAEGWVPSLEALEEIDEPEEEENAENSQDSDDAEEETEAEISEKEELSEEEIRLLAKEKKLYGWKNGPLDKLKEKLGL